MGSRFLAIGLSVLGYSILNLSQAVQKIGLHTRENNRLRGTIIWLVAIACGPISVLLVYAAISIASVSVVGAMAGTGLVALALFSALWMHERLEWRHLLAIAAIVGGAVLVGLYDSSASSQPRTVLLYGLLGAGTLVGGSGWVLSHRSRVRGVLVGGFAGFLGSYAQLFQNISTAETDLGDGVLPLLAAMLSEPLTLIWVGLSLSSMVVIQFAYKHGDAIQIIPVFTSLFILTPVVGGVLVFNETLVAPQIGGIVAIVVGAFVLGRRGRPTSSA